MQGPLGLRAVSVNCTASPLESPAEWRVTCFSAPACNFHVYEESRAIAPDAACAHFLVPPQQTCPECNCNY